MSTAENISPFKEPSPTFRVQSALKAEADVELEMIEACTADPEAGTLPNGSNSKSRALRRAFFAFVMRSTYVLRARMSMQFTHSAHRPLGLYGVCALLSLTPRFSVSASCFH